MVRVNIMWRFVSVGMCFFASNLAYGAIENTVTVTGSAPGPNNTVISVSATATESVDVIEAISTLEITKKYEFKTGNDDAYADKGEVITYIFEVKNTGNVTLEDVQVVEGSFNGKGDDVVPVLPDPASQVSAITDDVIPLNDSTDTLNTTDAIWGVLAPGDTVTFKGDYTVVQEDIDQLQN